VAEVSTGCGALPLGRSRRVDDLAHLENGPDKQIKLTLTYPASTGRNFFEILRVIDSLQLTANHKVATPADWKQGEDVIIIAGVSDEEADSRFPGYQRIKPYLRVTPQPKG
jgi:hypothetical protein